MRHLNYNHLQYFWTVAREGSIARAAEVLHLTPQTISGQIKVLEQSIGQPLFERAGRRLAMTETGRVVYAYAEEIFAIGAELASTVRSSLPNTSSTLVIGVVSSMPKLIAERIVAPAMLAEPPVRVRCHEARLDSLLADLAVHKLDLVLSDQPLPRGLSIKAYDHLLGESGLTFFAPKQRARGLKNRFPDSLTDAAMLLPTKNSALRRRLDEWFESHDIAPRIAGEFDDSALLKAFGEAGTGIFAGPSAIEEEIIRMYRVAIIGRTREITETYYAISPERRLKHEAVIAITKSARSDLFTTSEELELV